MTESDYIITATNLARLRLVSTALSDTLPDGVITEEALRRVRSQVAEWVDGLSAAVADSRDQQTFTGEQIAAAAVEVFGLGFPGDRISDWLEAGCVEDDDVAAEPRSESDA